MPIYSFVLLLHLLALLLAAGASAVVHMAEHRRASAASLRLAMEWGAVVKQAASLFPIAVLVLVLSGVYMVHEHWAWQVGWVWVGLVGALAMPASGIVIGKRGAASARRVAERLRMAGKDLPNDEPADRVRAMLLNGNSWLAIGIVTIMTLKPGFWASVTIVVLAWVTGALASTRNRVQRGGSPVPGSVAP